jgi:hypothetical protein
MVAAGLTRDEELDGVTGPLRIAVGTGSGENHGDGSVLRAGNPSIAGFDGQVK